MIKVFFTILSVLMLHYSFAQTSVYIKGSGFNNHSKRQLILNGIDQNIPSGRGLCLTIINAETHQHISSKVYDTYINASDANKLASELNNLNQKQIGILTSYDAWERNVTTDLIRVARRLGLYKLASDKLTTNYKHPYAAIFKGIEANSDTSPTSNYHAYEIMQSSDSEANFALIGTWLIEDTFIGSDLSNTLISTDPNVTETALLVDQNNNIGIGTTNPDEKLTVKGKIHSQEIKIDLNGALVPDYVFEKSYNLKPIQYISKYINENKHLPNIPSATEIEKGGFKVMEMNLKLLEKIEELTLYIIKQNQRINNLEKQLD